QSLQNTDILQVGGIEILYDCDDKSMTTVLKTTTGIKFDGAEVGVSTVTKMDNADPFRKSSKGGKSQMIMIGFVALLVIVVLVLLGVLAYIMFFREAVGKPVFLCPFLF
ncbi:MAG: hypothetical protein KAG97_09695, partial [Victivallales bacterium]|nr:hypothetical protein [Victivallales bacterium]